jgi:transporter family protein
MIGANTTAKAQSKRRTMLPPWFWLSLVTVILWGAWGLQSKVIADKISPWMNQVLFPIGLLPLMAWTLLVRTERRQTSVRTGTSWAFITGVLGGTGNIAFLAALGSGGKAAIVVPLVGLAPLVTVILAFFLLKESLTRAQMAGLVLALASIYLLSF